MSEEQKLVPTADPNVFMLAQSNDIATLAAIKGKRSK